MPQIPASEWDKDESGSLVVRALVGWGTIGATDGSSGVLRLEYATDQTLKERAAIQLFVSALRVRELAEGLARLAEYLERASAADKSLGPGPKRNSATYDRAPMYIDACREWHDRLTPDQQETCLTLADVIAGAHKGAAKSMAASLPPGRGARCDYDGTSGESLRYIAAKLALEGHRLNPESVRRLLGR